MVTSGNERIETERFSIDDSLWEKSDKEGRIRIGPEGRREVFQALSWFIRHAAAERAWPPAAEQIPLERLRSAAEDLLAAIGGLVGACAGVAKSNTCPSPSELHWCATVTHVQQPAPATVQAVQAH